MKPLFSVFLALLITLQPLSRLVILIEYEAQKELISKTLCEMKGTVNNSCQGKCQLKKQLAKVTESEKKANTTLKTLLEKEYQPNSYCFSFQISGGVIEIPQNGIYTEPRIPSFEKAIFHPPAA